MKLRISEIESRLIESLKKDRVKANRNPRYNPAGEVEQFVLGDKGKGADSETTNRPE